jgi:hypothetical protein
MKLMDLFEKPYYYEAVLEGKTSAESKSQGVTNDETGNPIVCSIRSVCRGRRGLRLVFNPSNPGHPAGIRRQDANPCVRSWITWLPRGSSHQITKGNGAKVPLG